MHTPCRRTRLPCCSSTRKRRWTSAWPTPCGGPTSPRELSGFHAIIVRNHIEQVAHCRCTLQVCLSGEHDCYIGQVAHCNIIVSTLSRDAHWHIINYCKCSAFIVKASITAYECGCCCAGAEGSAAATEDRAAEEEADSSWSGAAAGPTTCGVAPSVETASPRRR